MLTEKISSTSKKIMRRKSMINKITNIIKKYVFMNILNILYFRFCLCLNKIIDYSFPTKRSRETTHNLDKKHSILKESSETVAEKVRKEVLKSEALAVTYIERIKKMNPIRNDVTDERNEALKEEREDDKIIEGELPEEESKKKPFLRVPFNVRKSHAVKGMKNMLHTLGMRGRKGIRTDKDTGRVQLLRTADLPVSVDQ